MNRPAEGHEEHGQVKKVCTGLERPEKPHKEPLDMNDTKKYPLLSVHYEEKIEALGTDAEISEEVKHLAKLASYHQCRAMLLSRQIGNAYFEPVVHKKSLAAEDCVLCATEALHERGFCKNLTNTKRFSMTFDKLNQSYIDSLKEWHRLDVEVPARHFRDQQVTRYNRFGTAFEHLAQTGTFVVEDLHKKLADMATEMNQEYRELRGRLEQKANDDVNTVLKRRTVAIEGYRQGCAEMDAKIRAAAASEMEE
ncbi:hypothetical protein GCK72_025740 [Caenorhabditis remanei]|uniref:Uncharacterized protein n=1 Tax=Caenorhabditis remanei TaxID=31234 RepID=A0A6A5G393_CAERE|nr:hypothetical protein GCK72_025740 [Caenorhabditis remanei]KAF1749273.1 hypothetical protein GCK72_025740 [Caenorhabditis remanei]